MTDNHHPSTEAQEERSLVLSARDAAELYNLAVLYFGCRFPEPDYGEDSCLCDNCHLRRWFEDHGMRHNPLLTGEPFDFSEPAPSSIEETS